MRDMGNILKCWLVTAYMIVGNHGNQSVELVLLFYYSMGCNDNSDWARRRVAVLISISFTCFVILMVDSWTLEILYQQQANGFLMGGAVVSSLSVLCFAAIPIYACIKCCFCADENKEKTMQNVILLVEMIAGFLTFAAGILYFAAGALMNAAVPVLLTFGACVSVFGFISVILPERCCKRDLQEN